MSSNDVMEAELKFLADRSAPLAYVPSKGGGDETEHLGNYCLQRVVINNARHWLPATDLDQEGFKLVAHESRVEDFYDDDLVKNIYHAELAELLGRVTRASRIEIFDDTRRSSSTAYQRERGARDPANIVHNDYTAHSGQRRLEDFFADSPEQVQRLKRRRFAIINAWRPIGEPVLDYPLVVCDARTVAEDDLVAVERRGADRVGELQVALHDRRQSWYYFPNMNRNEVLLFKTFDSALDGRTRFTPHSSCKVPDAPVDAPPRESLETRCLVFFD